MMLMATLSGCGGGGSDGGNTDSPTPPGVYAAWRCQEKAIDGYIQGATVYLVLNFNRQWEDGEPKTTTNDAGDYRLRLPVDLQTCAQYAPLSGRCTGGCRGSGSWPGDRSLSNGPSSHLCFHHQG